MIAHIINSLIGWLRQGLLQPKLTPNPCVAKDILEWIPNSACTHTHEGQRERQFAYCSDCSLFSFSAHAMGERTCRHVQLQVHHSLSVELRFLLLVWFGFSHNFFLIIYIPNVAPLHGALSMSSSPSSPLHFLLRGCSPTHWLPLHPTSISLP